MNWLKTFIITCVAVLTINCGSNQDGTNANKSITVSAGEQVYTKSCKVCHAQGINGAPILGNKKMWSKRIARDKTELVKNAIQGYGLMPPKGGQSHLNDEQVAEAVNFMLSKL